MAIDIGKIGNNMDKRELIHQRNIEINCYEIAENMLLVEGTLSDERLFDSLVYSANRRHPAGFIHTMKVAMEISLPTMEIVAITTTMPVVPMAECVLTAKIVEQLKGRRITSGFTRNVRELIGGTKGCLHTLNLIMAMASASVQGSWSFYSRIRGDDKPLPPLNDEESIIDSCWMWRSDGMLVDRYRRAKQRFANPFIVTIDGPAGSGKSTVSKMLARKLGFACLDTGGIYRALALKVIRSSVEDCDHEAIRHLCSTTKIEIRGAGETMQVFLDGEDVSEAIRSEAVSSMASRVSSLSFVREALMEIQRGVVKNGAQGIIAEGRDMGSVVFPQATLKFFLEAAVSKRAERRYQELRERDEFADREETIAAIIERDRRDTTREVAPLVVPQGAIIIDTSLLTVAEVAGVIEAKVKAKIAGE
ncbi:MAG: (d)CMP kinase [Deltaproteobacteria bacterium]|nr:(d)CMP kinase [Deltaproteobacteria bacterium]